MIVILRSHLVSKSELTYVVVAWKQLQILHYLHPYMRHFMIVFEEIWTIYVFKNQFWPIHLSENNVVYTYGLFIMYTIASQRKIIAYGSLVPTINQFYTFVVCCALQFTIKIIIMTHIGTKLSVILDAMSDNICTNDTMQYCMF